MISKELIRIREAELEDCAGILRLMVQLAKFEGYVDRFAVDHSELEKRLFIQKDFSVLIAEADKSVVGILVYYYLPFTYDLTAWIYINDLFIEPHYRFLGIAKKLMKSLAKEAVNKGSSKIRCGVLSTNHFVIKFYESLGAENEQDLCLFSLQREKINKLVEMP